MLFSNYMFLKNMEDHLEIFFKNQDTLSKALWLDEESYEKGGIDKNMLSTNIFKILNIPVPKDIGMFSFKSDEYFLETLKKIGRLKKQYYLNILEFQKSLNDFKIGDDVFIYFKFLTHINIENEYYIEIIPVVKVYFEKITITKIKYGIKLDYLKIKGLAIEIDHSDRLAINGTRNKLSKEEYLKNYLHSHLKTTKTHRQKIDNNTTIHFIKPEAFCLGTGTLAKTVAAYNTCIELEQTDFLKDIIDKICLLLYPLANLESDEGVPYITLNNVLEIYNQQIISRSKMGNQVFNLITHPDFKLTNIFSNVLQNIEKEDILIQNSIIKIKESFFDKPVIKKLIPSDLYILKEKNSPVYYKRGSIEDQNIEFRSYFLNTSPISENFIIEEYDLNLKKEVNEDLKKLNPYLINSFNNMINYILKFKI